MKTLLSSENLLPGLEFCFQLQIFLWDGLEFPALLPRGKLLPEELELPLTFLPFSSVFPGSYTSYSLKSRAGNLLRSLAPTSTYPPSQAKTCLLVLRPASSMLPFLEELMLVGPAGAGDLVPGLVAVTGNITHPQRCGDL